MTLCEPNFMIGSGKLNKVALFCLFLGMETKSIYRRSETNVRPYCVSSYEIELCLRTDSARPLARSYCLAIRELGEWPRFQPLCVPVGMESVAALMAALHQIEDDPNHKGRISLPNSLVLTCEPPQYVIGDGKAARFVFPVLDNLREFANAMGSTIAPNRKSADRPNAIAREPEAQAEFVNAAESGIRV